MHHTNDDNRIRIEPEVYGIRKPADQCPPQTPVARCVRQWMSTNPSHGRFESVAELSPEATSLFLVPSERLKHFTSRLLS
jgi:hypothetical protein